MADKLLKTESGSYLKTPIISDFRVSKNQSSCVEKSNALLARNQHGPGGEFVFYKSSHC